MYGCLNKALDQMSPQACRHVGQMANLLNDFHDQIAHLMIDDAWHSGKEPHSNELGFKSIPRPKLKPTWDTSTKAPWLGLQDVNHQIKGFKQSIKLHNRISNKWPKIRVSRSNTSL